MRILVTGARGFVGKNLVANLMNVKEGKDRNRNFVVDEVYSYDIDTDPVLLEEYCQKADFVFHLAGVNRPKDQSEFMEGNFGFSSTLLEKLKALLSICQRDRSKGFSVSLPKFIWKVVPTKLQ